MSQGVNILEQPTVPLNFDSKNNRYQSSWHYRTPHIDDLSVSDHYLSLLLLLPLLNCQAEDEVRGNVLSLRTENSYLTAEINDFRHRMALNDEQVGNQ